METNWPFEEPRNTAVITTKQIMQGGAPILSVIHDRDGEWQFLDGGDVMEDDTVVVGLGNLLSRDPGLRLLADLPCGWIAWRESRNMPWQRKEESW